MLRALAISGFLACAGALALPDDPPQAPPDFNRDVRPILADRCFRCHGPDSAARKRGLRLDNFQGATAELASGLRAIVPGDVNASEMARRISSDDPDEFMPPPELKHPLTDAEKKILLRWIESGAEYRPHWSLLPPKAAAPPEVKEHGWPRDPIDRFILAKLEADGLPHAPEADLSVLLRRAALALTGLPPTPEETDAFLADDSKDAYEKQLDRLLSSPRFGERMAADWLDVARYADTYGYQSDWECRVWPWRDWLINAFNTNLPYDQFVRDQIAGDLLPNATDAQKIATAFNRLHRQTNEGGSIDEEFRQEYISDRVQTYGTAFLGLTVECARCHDHKYDPIPQVDYYSLGAFFGAIDEAGTYPYATPAIPRPAMRLISPDQAKELSWLQSGVDAAEAELKSTLAAREPAFNEWLSHADSVSMLAPLQRHPLEGDIERPAGKATLLDGDTGPTLKDMPNFRRCDPHSLVFWMRSPDSKARATVIHTSKFTIESDEQGYQVMLKDGKLCWEVVHNFPGSAVAVRTINTFPLNEWVQVAVTYGGTSQASGLAIYLNGRRAPTEVTHDHLDGPATVRSFQIGFRDRDLGFKGGAIADLQVFDRELTALEAAELNHPGAIKSALESRSKESRAALLEFFRANDPDCIAATKTLQAARAAYQDALESIPELMIMEESRHPRPSFVLIRGQYDQPDKSRPVHADRAIDALLPFDQSWPHNRAGLAQWTTDPKNPLTARVAVNRLWSLCFGRGLVPTLENFGTQGEAPIHQDVLDTLAADFIKSGWNVKAMMKRILLSSTFRQSSDLADPRALSDPQNTRLSRGPSLRLSAEAIRDQALFASGLLVEKQGGPSVRPWQPPGLYEDAGVSSQGAYMPDTGDNAHRRSLYTFKKRTAPPPNMQAFDSGSGEKCLSRRLITNTPQQALVLLNDPVFFECARALAQRAAKESGENPSDQITRAFRLLASRPPRSGELTPLLDLYNEQLRAFQTDEPAAKQVNGSDDPNPKTAALSVVCSTLLASDAAMTSR